jgi:hypothetical protein
VQDDGPPRLNTGRFDTTRQPAGGMPTWPELDDHPPRYTTSGGRASLLVGGLAVSLGANAALLIALLVVLLLGRTGALAPGKTSAQSTTGLGLASPTVNGNATPSPTSGALTNGRLQVAPSSVQLGCDSGQQRQFVVLLNTGSDDIRWHADTSRSGDQAAVNVSPNDGTLRAGTSIAIQIQNQSNGDSQQGTITFNADSPSAGQPPTLAFSAAGC